MISTHAAKGISPPATFSILVSIGGRKAIALIDSGSTNTFMDYTFASTTSCTISSTCATRAKVAGGGHLDSCATITDTSYCIQFELFSGDFTLLQLKGYDIIFGYHWIKQHNPIALDLEMVVGS
jgi:hypothetical protein